MNNKKLRLVFDVDGVVAKPYDANGVLVPYSDRQPYEDAVRNINWLKAQGHTIIFQTARWMNRFAGHQQKAHDAGYYELQLWLNEHGIPYDEIYLGKCSSDLYIDDRGFRLESEQGSEQWERLLKHIDLMGASYS
jgi:capsule biosynthesis phosphatase